MKMEMLVDVSSWVVVAVDDEPDSLEVLTEVLGMYDATVHPCSSGKEVLAKLESVTPTLIVTDLSMPGMDGYQLLFQIRKIERLKAIPVLALTAHAMSGDRERILEAGFSGYVSKPYRTATLIEEILSGVPSLNTPAPVAAPKPEENSSLSKEAP
jgi:CheY-like chemotaxis protein